MSSVSSAIRAVYRVASSSLFDSSSSSSLSSSRTINLEESTDRAEIVLGICEGEIEGLEDGARSFYVSDTALQNASGDYNFEDLELEILPGSGSDNEEISYYLGGAAKSTSVGVQLAYNTPVVRQTETGDIDFIELRMTITTLMSQGKKSMEAGSMEVNFEYKKLSDKTWKNVTSSGQPIIYKGKISGTTVSEIRIEVERANEPYEIRITKKTADGDNSSTFNTISWESFQDGVTTAVSFPNTALAHLYLQYSNQLTSVPSFYGIYKLQIIRIPSNYDPVTREYDGEWDGTFKRAWSDNPAWCLYDFVMNDRYGVNAFSTVNLDKWDCYEAGKWCDELVSDGKGGTQPRYTCNLLQTDATNGREFAVYMAGLFNGTLVEESTGYLRLYIEKDADAVFLFTPENVTDTGFSYSMTSPETRYNDIKVSFTNPDLSWETDTRRVYNQDDIDENGRITYDFIAVGCIREGEAMRRAYYKMITALTEVTTVTFTTNRQAQCLSNFDIILIADPVLGYSIPGRIKGISEDRKTVYLRDSVYLEAGIPYKIQFNIPEGLHENEINPVSGSGSLKEFTLQEPLPENIPDLATFTISGSTRSGTPKPFRIVSIAESQDSADQYTITALELNRNKWDASDNMEFSGMASFSGLPSVNDIPHILDASFYLYYDKVNLETDLTITPEYDTSYPYYSGGLVVYSKAMGSDVWVKRTVVNNNTVTDHPSGEYQFIILPMSTTGITPPFSTAPIFTYIVEDTMDYPSNVKNFQVVRSISGVQLSWDAVDDIDLAGYEVREGTDWETGTVITTDFSGTSLFNTISDADTHYYMVCAKNYRGFYSMIPAYLSTTVYAPDDVPAFYATTSQDRIRFDWTQVEGTDVEYEIRQGNAWNSAILVARAKGNSTSILMPATADSVFCIKACSSAGLYSENPRYTHPDTELFSNRNVILELDNGAEGFPGITYGFEPLEYVDKALVMKQEVTRAEHYFPVVLNKETRARNWLETQAFSYGSRLTWEDLHYRYTQTEAHISWINSKSLDSDGTIETVIMKYRQPDDYTALYGFPYDNYTNDIKEKIYSSYEYNISYEDSRITPGLILTDTTKLIYDSGLAIPDVYYLTLKLKVTDESEDDINILTLINSKTHAYMKLYAFNGKLYMRSSDHKDIVIDFKHAAAVDFITIGISQTTTERILYFFADYGNFESYETIEATPVGSFDQYYINRKIGEPL
jgi:predicted phage tail protein